VLCTNIYLLTEVVILSVMVVDRLIYKNMTSEKKSSDGRSRNGSCVVVGRRGTRENARMPPAVSGRTEVRYQLERAQCGPRYDIRTAGRHSTPPWKEIFACEKGKIYMKINRKYKNIQNNVDINIIYI
jgi:hypothetical protein